MRRIPKKYHTKEKSNRHFTLTWNLCGKPVCKIFFLRTLGFSNDQFIFTVLKCNARNGIVDVDVQDAAPDQRGKSKSRLPRGYKNHIKTFILSMNPTISHYNPDPHQKINIIDVFQKSNVKIKDVFRLFVNHCKENGMEICSWTYFYVILKKLNLSTTDSAAQ